MHGLLLAVLLRNSAVDDAVNLVMRAQHVAGLSIGISHAGKVMYEHAYGWRDLATRSPAQVQTIYRIGSLTKSFTAAAILDLSHRGKLTLHDSVAQYVTRFPWPHTITVEQLLTHESGIPSYSDSERLDRHRAYTPQELIDAVASQPLAFEPGKYWQYSNTNYVLLGMIVTRVSGTSYESYLQSAVVDPLHLHSTRYGDQPGEAGGYAGDSVNAPVALSSTSFGYAAAGMTSNVPDLLTWLQTIPEPYYGFFEAHMYGRQVVYASGNVNGFSSLALISPHTDDIIVILTNADELDLIPLAKSVFAALDRGAAYAPKRRSRAVKSCIACTNCSRVKSGQRVGSDTISVYAS
jgi:CubicO group peptidase (beta-lactamase class C family)